MYLFLIVLLSWAEVSWAEVALLIDCNITLSVQAGRFYWVLTVYCGVEWSVGWHNYLLNEPQQSKQVPTLPALISEHFPIKLTANRSQNVNSKLATFMFNIKRLLEKQMELNCNKLWKWKSVLYCFSHSWDTRSYFCS